MAIKKYARTDDTAALYAFFASDEVRSVKRLRLHGQRPRSAVTELSIRRQRDWPPAGVTTGMTFTQKQAIALGRRIDK